MLMFWNSVLLKFLKTTKIRIIFNNIFNMTVTNLQKQGS